LLVAVGQLGHVVQAAAADDADRGIGHLLLAAGPHPRRLPPLAHARGADSLRLVAWGAACLSSIKTPPVADGWTNPIRDPSAPGRGSSSISRAPCALRRASAARRSSTRKVT